MSIPKDRPMHTDYRQVVCNGCGQATSAHPSQTVEEMRATIARHGWTHKASARSTKDFCPRCSAGRAKED